VDPDRLNTDPDPAFLLNPDPDPSQNKTFKDNFFLKFFVGIKILVKNTGVFHQILLQKVVSAMLHLFSSKLKKKILKSAFFH
jgi:hypothetical protein